LPLLLPSVNGTPQHIDNPTVVNKNTPTTTPINSYLQERLSLSHLDLHNFHNSDHSYYRGLRTLIDRNQFPWEVCNLSDKEVVWPERCISHRPNDLQKAAKHAADNWKQPLTDETILAAYICCEEKDPTNIWFTLYRSTLPKSLLLIIENLEEMMTEEEESSLFRNCLPQCHFNAIQSTIEYVEKQYKSCAEAFEAVGLSTLTPSWERFRYAFALVRSRSFALSTNFFEENDEDPSLSRLVTQQISSTTANINTHRVLLPLYDLLNHQTGAKARIEKRIHPQTKVKSWHVISESLYSKGDEIFNSYGDERGNFELLLQYGFCCPNNAANRIAFDWKDLIQGLVVSQPLIFGNANSISSLTSRLQKEEMERRSKPLQNLALYSVNVENGKLIPSERLKETLDTFTKIAVALGMKAEIEINDKEDLSREILDAMIQARLVKLDACLQRIVDIVGGRGGAVKDKKQTVDNEMETGHFKWWREQIHTFLEAEREVLRSVLSS